MTSRIDGLAFAVGGTGDPLVLLHPVGLDHTFWEPVAHRLERSHMVYRVDMPGHGQTPITKGDWSISRYAEAVAAFIFARCGSAVSVVGLSFGGMIAQELALTRPELVRKLVLCGCTAGFPESARPAIRERGLLAEEKGMAAVVAVTLQRWFTPAFLDAGGAEPVRKRLLSDSVEGWAAAWNAIASHDTERRLVGLDMPVLCIAGENDLAAPPDAVRRMSSFIRSAHFELLSRAPHMMHIEAQEELSVCISRFLQLACPGAYGPRPDSGRLASGTT